MAVPYKFANQPAGQILPLGWLDADFAYIEDQLLNVVAGSNSQIQFNNNGIFGANPNFVFDNTNVRLGIGVSAPTSSLTVSGPYSPTIGQVDILGTGSVQQITLRDTTNPSSDNRGLALIGEWDGSVTRGKVISAGELSLASFGGATPAIRIPTNSDVLMPMGVLNIGSPINSTNPKTGFLKLFNSASANSVTLTSGNNASNWTMVLPTSPGTAGQVLRTDGAGNTSWQTIGGSAATPVNSVQFNKAGSFGGSANFVYDETKTYLGLGVSSPFANIHISSVANLSSGQIAICSPDYSTITLNSGNNLPADETARIVATNDASLPGGKRLNLTTTGSHPILLSPNNASALTANPNGNISIGSSTSSGASVYIQNSTGFNNPQVDLRAPDYCYLSFSKGSNLLTDQIARIVTVNNPSLSGGLQLSLITGASAPILLQPGGVVALQAQPNGDVWAPNGKLLVGRPATLTGNIQLYNSGNSNTVTLTPSGSSSNWTLTLPTGPGTVGQVLSTNGAGVTSWIAAGGGSATPAGSNTQIQFNNSGAFGANANFVFNNANTRVGIGTASPGAPLHISNPNIPNVGQLAISSPDYSAISFGPDPSNPSNNIARIVSSNVSSNPGGQGIDIITGGAYPITLIANNAELGILPNGEFVLSSSGSSGTLYIQGGALWFRGGSGTVTQIAPA